MSPRGRRDGQLSGRTRSLTASLPFVLGFYFLVSVLFTALYFEMACDWRGSDFRDYASFSTDYPGYVPAFRFRILMPVLVKAIAGITRLDPRWILEGLAALSVFTLLLVFRRYLAHFLLVGHSTVFSLAIVYPMLWNFCLLNSLYFPFDLPGLLFFLMGCHLVYTRNWHAYYPTLVLATLNRETSIALIFTFLLCLWRRMPARTILWHLLAQILLWVGLKAGIFLAMGGNAGLIAKSHLASNGRVILDMLLFRGSGPKDWVKLLLAFGGTWLAIPWVLPIQPVFLKRCLLVVIPFLVLTAMRGVIDEVRLYSELIPVIVAPLVYVVAAELGGSRIGERPAEREQRLKT